MDTFYNTYTYIHKKWSWVLRSKLRMNQELPDRNSKFLALSQGLDWTEYDEELRVNRLGDTSG